MQSRIYSVEDVKVESLIVIPENPPAIAVSAVGTVVSTGWTHADLSPWMYIMPPKDGILDLDFVATPPSGINLPVITPISVTKTFVIPRWVRGVRVHASRGAMEALLKKGASKKPASKKLSTTQSAPKSAPYPWPWPWWKPPEGEATV